MPHHAVLPFRSLSAQVQRVYVVRTYVLYTDLMPLPPLLLFSCSLPSHLEQRGGRRPANHRVRAYVRAHISAAMGSKIDLRTYHRFGPPASPCSSVGFSFRRKEEDLPPRMPIWFRPHRRSAARSMAGAFNGQAPLVAATAAASDRAPFIGATGVARDNDQGSAAALWRHVQDLLLQCSEYRSTIVRLQNELCECDSNHVQNLLLQCSQYRSTIAYLTGECDRLRQALSIPLQPCEAGPPTPAPSAKAQGDKNFHFKVHYSKKAVIMDDKRGVVFEATESAREARNRRRREDYQRDKARMAEKKAAELSAFLARQRAMIELGASPATHHIELGSTTAAASGSAAASSGSEGIAPSPAAGAAQGYTDDEQPPCKKSKRAEPHGDADNCDQGTWTTATRT